MGPINCAIIGCTNNSRQLHKWKMLNCEVHQGKLKADCGCEPPFRLFCFPGEIRYKEKREIWIKLINRINPDKSVWKATKNDRICSFHFVDKIPTI